MNRFRRAAGRRPPGVLLLAIVLGGGAADAGAQGRPEEVRSWRHEILSTERYEELARAWGAYVDKHPEDVRAWVEWGDACRYSGQRDAGLEKYARAYEIDSTDAAAASAYCSNAISPDDGEWSRYHDRLQAAALSDPGYAPLYYTLWMTSLHEGDQELAERCLTRAVELGEISRPLLDYGANMLAGAPANAIILTNGDNDTYPPLAYQALSGERTDVAIVNLSLLNTKWYIRYHQERGVPFGLDDSQIEALKHGKNGLIHEQMQRLLFESLKRKGWPRPLLYSVTVYDKNRALPGQVLEGILQRVVEQESAEEDSFDIDRTQELFDTVYRTDAMTDPLFDWRRESSVAKLGLNYAHVLRALGEGLIERGDDGERYLYRAASIFAFHGGTEHLDDLIEQWRRKRPDSKLLRRAEALPRRGA